MDTKNKEVASVLFVPGRSSTHAVQNAAMLHAYVEHRQNENIGAPSIKHYRWLLGGLFLGWLAEKGDRRLADVTEKDIRSFLAGQRQRLSAASLASLATQLRRFLQYLEATQRIFVNPMSKWILRKVPIRMQAVPTEAEVRRLLEAPDAATPQGIRDRALMETVYSTGVRLSELLGLSVRDPDLDKGVVRVLGKGRKERVVPLGRHAGAWLRRYLQSARAALLAPRKDAHHEEQAMWLNKYGRPLGMKMVELLCAKYAHAVGIATPITPHALRRACATHLLRNGAHPVEIQTLLGHATLDTLGHYLHVNLPDLKRMHARSKIGR